LYILLTDIAHVVYGALNYYYLLHYRGLGVVLLALYVIYQVVDSATRGSWREIVGDVLEYAVGLLLGYIAVATYPYWKPYVPVELPV
jgi:hypothetical protein